MEVFLFTAIFLPFAAVPILLGCRRLGGRAAWVALGFPLTSLALVGIVAARSGAFEQTVFVRDWIPVLDVNWAFMVDGVSLFYGLIATSMGVLVTFYARFYLEDRANGHARFHAWMMLFMGAMLGTVFAENLLILVLFWELTGVASFLLIGFDDRDREARAAARMALLVTAGAGLALLAGVALLGHLGGTLSLSRLLETGLRDAPASSRNAAFLLLAIGVIGKSAQFPLHFWLPKAMAAPTPVSAYLHSAAMVNLGVFLVARLFPLFHDAPAWELVLIPVGCFTMIWGALLALLSHDLKRLLAYATVSQLGLFLGLYGLEARTGASHDFLHIADHVLYKGLLFMVAGIVAHVLGTRDLRRTGGLGRRLPWLAAAGFVGCATMAGLPGTIGYVSRGEVLGIAWHYAEARGEFWSTVPLLLAVATFTLNVVLAARVFWCVFVRPSPDKERFRTPGAAIQFPPGILATCCIFAGVVPHALQPMLEGLRVSGLHVATAAPPELWSGLTREFFTGAGVIAAGLLLFAVAQRSNWSWTRLPAGLRFEAHAGRARDVLRATARRVMVITRTDAPGDYLPVTVASFVFLMGAWLVAQREAFGLTWPRVVADAQPDGLRSFVVVLVSVLLVLTLRLRQWNAQLIALSMMGFLLTFYYVLFRAPDLAMTQVLVDSISLLLVLLLLVRFSHAPAVGEQRDRPPPGRRLFNVCLSTALGLVMAACVHVFAARRPANAAGDFYLANSEPLAHGQNAVNTILVDFRALDTVFEITVLLTAMLGGVALFMRYRRTSREYAAGADHAQVEKEEEEPT